MARANAVLRLVVILGAALTMATSASAKATAEPCDDACLLSIAGDYMDALTANDPAGAPLDPHVRATENGQPVKAGDGLWATARSWRYRHTVVDATTGEIAVLGVVSEGPAVDAIVGLRLKVAGRRIVESELMVARQGDFALFQPRYATEAPAIFTAYTPADRRMSRAFLATIPHRYFEAIAHGDPSLVPVHPDANRLENGVQITNSPDMLTPSTREGLRRLVYMQRFRSYRAPVIDTARGLVFAVVAVDMPLMTRTLTLRGRPVEINPQRQHLPRTLYLFELFKVEDGQIRAIEAVMRNLPFGVDTGWPGEAFGAD